MNPRDAEAAAQIEEGLVRRVRAALLGVALNVQCVFALPRILTELELYQPLWSHAVVFCLLLAVAGVGAYHVLVGRRPSRTSRVLGVGATFAASLLTTTSLTPADVMNTEHWTFGVVGWYCLVLLFGEPLRILVAVFGVHFVLAAAPLVLSGLPDIQMVAPKAISAVSVYGFQLTVGMFAYTVRKIANKAAQAAAEEERSRTQKAVAESAHRYREERFLGLLDTTIPLLRAIADGELDPSDPDAQRRCAVESARLRRLQAENDDVPDPLAHELEAGLGVADRRGVTAQLEITGDPVEVPKVVRRELVDPVLAVLSATRDSARVTLLRTPEQVRVSIVSDAAGAPPIDSCAEHVRVEEITLEKEWWVQTVWNRHDASPSQ
ncbi:hypothetical protein [Streptomyces armeniacus]|uniref:hypothetical protein n=1 Tax=Streptomyces armeniacus TaxID=83291 RepID=UPI001AD84B0D|nr:hypothetical protein [Streptomyces armeniacus]